MILFIIAIVVAVIGVVLLILSNKLWWDDLILILNAGIMVAGFVAIITMGLISGLVNSSTACRNQRIKYEEQVTELNKTYTVINDIDDAYAKYTAIQQYNVEVKEFKTKILQEQQMLKNPWINWFRCKEYKNFDANAVSYIEA